MKFGSVTSVYILSLTIVWSILFFKVNSKNVSQIISISQKCEDSYHMLINSFAASCTEAWRNVEAILTDRQPREVGLDICSVYCLNPVKTSTEMCPELKPVYDFVLNLCCKNDRNENCLGTFVSLNESFPSPTCPNNTDNCTSSCSTFLNTTLNTMGCCFSMLNNTAYQDGNITGPYDPIYWNQCEVPLPETCECSYDKVDDNSTIIYSNNLTILSLFCVVLMSYYVFSF